MTRLPLLTLLILTLSHAKLVDKVYNAVCMSTLPLLELHFLADTAAWLLQLSFTDGHTSTIGANFLQIYFGDIQVMPQPHPLTTPIKVVASK